MLVHDIMQSPVITVTLRTAASEALGLLRTRGIRHLVVVEGDDVVGIVSDRDTKEIAAQRFTEWVVASTSSSARCRRPSPISSRRSRPAARRSRASSPCRIPKAFARPAAPNPSTTSRDWAV